MISRRESLWDETTAKINDGLAMSNEKITYRLHAVCLILGSYKGRQIHVVAANNCLDEEIIVITVYEPDPSEWDLECRKRI